MIKFFELVLKLPAAYGIGQFMATMYLYKTDQYLEPYQANPQLNTGDYLNVGKWYASHTRTAIHTAGISLSQTYDLVLN